MTSEVFDPIPELAEPDLGYVAHLDPLAIETGAQLLAKGQARLEALDPVLSRLTPDHFVVGLQARVWRVLAQARQDGKSGPMLTPEILEQLGGDMALWPALNDISQANQEGSATPEEVESLAGVLLRRAQERHEQSCTAAIETKLAEAKARGLPHAELLREVAALVDQFREAEPSAHRSEPIDPFVDHPVPQFPLDVLPESFADYAASCSMSTGFDAGAYGFSLMVLAAGMIDHRARLQVGQMKVPPHLWGCLSAQSSGGKSPVLDAAAFVVHSLNKQMLRDSIRQHEQWAKQVKADPKDTTPAPPMRQLLLDNTTTEAAGKALRDNPEGLMLVLPEMSEWVGRMDAYSGQGSDKDRGVWIRAFDGGSVSINRAKDSIPMLLENFSAGILTGIQPEKLAQMFAKSAAGGADGLFQRFLGYQMSPAAKADFFYTPDPVIESSVAEIFRKLNQWRDEGMLKHFKLSLEATAAAQDHLNNLRLIEHRTPAGRFQEHIGKLAGLTMRVTFVLHVMRSAADGVLPAETIPLQAFQQAQRVMRVLYQHAEAAYSHLDRTGIGASIKLARAACEAILTKQWTTFQRGDLTRHATGWDAVEDRVAEAAIDLLIQWAWIEDVTPDHVPGKRGRRSSGKFEVNPQALKRFKPHAQRIARERADRHEAILKLAGSVQAAE